MEKFTTIVSPAVPLKIEDVDTDQIIPARFLKATTREGFGDNLFRDWRYNQDDSPKDFILNNKTKVCLSANSSLKIITVDFIKDNHEITLQFRSGDLYISIPNNSIDTHNIKFFNYSIKNFKNDLLLSKGNEFELINYRNSLNLFFKDKKNKSVPPFSYLKLMVHLCMSIVINGLIWIVT